MAKSASSSPEININLMPGSEESQGSIGSAIHWALTIGRYLVIFTEIVAIAIFILSIKLSADKQDLKESVSNLTKQVAAQEDFEKEFRSVQDRINEVKDQRSSHFLNNKVLSEFLTLLPQGMTLETLELAENEITFSGSFATPKELQTLILTFSQSDTIVGLNISKLEHPNESSKRFEFSASAVIIPSTFLEGAKDGDN